MTCQLPISYLMTFSWMKKQQFGMDMETHKSQAPQITHASIPNLGSPKVGILAGGASHMVL
jgi:hypothetical protein